MWYTYSLHLAHYKVNQHVIQVCFTFNSLQSKTACDTCMFLHLAYLLIKYKLKKAHTFGTVPKSKIKLSNKFEDIEGVTRSRKSMDRQCNTSQKEKDKSKNNHLQNTVQKAKDWVTRTQLKTEGELRRAGRVTVLAPRVSPVDYHLI